MPTIFHLGENESRLNNVHLIIGEGLCSNIYVVGRQEATIIDTGVGNYRNPVWPQLNQIGVQPENVKNVILTHAHHDHAMGAFIILEQSSPEIYVHSLDTKYIASRFGENLVKVEEGYTIETELWPLEVTWTPGHTKGGMVLYARKPKVLFSGDIVFPDGYYGRYDGESGSIEEIIYSLKKLTELDVDILLSGHGRPIFTDGNKHIQQAYKQASRPR